MRYATAVYSPSNAPHMSVTLGVLKMLADHYPERLYRAYVCNAPSIFSLAFKVISPFVDPVSRSKVWAGGRGVELSSSCNCPPANLCVGMLCAQQFCEG